MNPDYRSKIISFYEKEKRMPTYAEMTRLFGFQSKNAVSKVVDKLIDSGFVCKDHLGRIVPKNFFNELPLLGSVKAGFPSDATEICDSINIENLLVQKKGSTYMLNVDGDSMIDEHIADGDMIIVEKTNTAKDGQIVVAEIDGEFTLKYFRKEGSKVWLEPANDNFKPMYPKNSLNICAVLKAVIRKY